MPPFLRWNGMRWGGGQPSPMLVNLPLTANLNGKVAGGLTFSRASSQWGTADNGALVQAVAGVPFFNSKGVPLEPASTNKCTCYGVIPADSYGTTRASGYVLVKGVKYEIISRLTLDFTTVGAASNTVGTQFISTGGTLSTGDSVKDVLFGVGTKSYYSSAWAQNHTNMTLSGDTAAVLMTVDDTAALTAAGLMGICPSGKVYKLDNSPGATNAYVSISGAVGNLNPHSASVFACGTSADLVLQGDKILKTGVVTGTFSIVEANNFTPTSIGEVMSIRTPPGTVTYFILPQLEELPYCTSPMPCLGATATRAGTSLSFPTAGNMKPEGVTIYLEATPVAFAPVGGVNAFTPMLLDAEDINNAMGLSIDTTPSSPAYYIRNKGAGVSSNGLCVSACVAGSTYKVVGRWSAGAQVFVNGVKGGVTGAPQAITLPALMFIGYRQSAAQYTSPTYIRNLRIYRKPLPDAQCIAMTT